MNSMIFLKIIFLKFSLFIGRNISEHENEVKFVYMPRYQNY